VGGRHKQIPFNGVHIDMIVSWGPGTNSSRYDPTYPEEEAEEEGEENDEEDEERGFPAGESRFSKGR
jgi:hypothetical protein